MEEVGAQDLRAAINLLRRVAKERDLLNELTVAERAEFLTAAGDVFCADPGERRQRVKILRRQRRAARLARDEERLDETGIRKLRNRAVFTTPNVFPPTDPQLSSSQLRVGTEESQPIPQLASPADSNHTEEEQHCYICKANYREIHHFYDQLCPECSSLNYTKRSEVADLTGMVALLTGGRVKIGYQAGIKLLRSGASLIVATRFPRDAAARYSAESDFADWSDRLEVFGLDMRHTPSVEGFCQHVLQTRERLDFIVNNACQTVRRPPAFYRHMMAGESAALGELPPAILGLVGAYEGLRGSDLLPSADSSELAVGLASAAELSQRPLLPEEFGSEAERAQGSLFPEGQLDKDLQQVDLRDRNSWRLLLHEVSAVELLETQLVNAVAPFIINGRLRPLMDSTPGSHKHIVNVSAVEGQFYRRFKTTRHPHTNMAKAALNMMTRTSATDFVGSGIHMNSVDTGWVSDEDPVAIADRKTVEHRFHPPLDIVDGAARIVDPIIDGINTGAHQWGQFFKDYRPTDW